MGIRNRPLLAVALCALSCSSSSKNAAHDTGPDASAIGEAAAPAVDGSADDATDDGATDDGQSDGPDDVRSDVLPRGLFGTMTFYELASAQAKTLALSISFHEAFFHDYDDTQTGNGAATGCTADHFAARTKPVPYDEDAGVVRVSGFLGGTMLTGDDGANPITCTLTGSYYGCEYPEGADARDARFSPSSMPFGPAPIAFAGNGGNNFGAFYVSGPPNVGTLSVSDDLTALRYDATQDIVLHPTCASACPGARVAVEVTAYSSAWVGNGWPYPTMGVVRCVFASTSTVTVPRAAIAAALASDASFDSVDTAVVLLPSAPVQTRDFFNNPFSADVGRGVVGTSPL